MIGGKYFNSMKKKIQKEYVNFFRVSPAFLHVALWVCNMPTTRCRYVWAIRAKSTSLIFHQVQR